MVQTKIGIVVLAVICFFGSPRLVKDEMSASIRGGSPPTFCNGQHILESEGRCTGDPASNCSAIQRNDVEFEEPGNGNNHDHFWNDLDYCKGFTSLGHQCSGPHYLESHVSSDCTPAETPSGEWEYPTENPVIGIIP